MKTRILAAAAALCLILSACGGGNSPSQSESAPEAPENAQSAPAPSSVPLAPENQEPPESQPEDAAPAETVEGTPEENEAYAEAYLRPVAAGTLLRTDFGPGNMQTLYGSVLIHAFEDLTGTEQMEQYWAEYDGDFPREVVEDCLTAHFDLTPEDLRENLLEGLYLPEEDVYRYYGGRGGGPVDVQVDASRRTGDQLELDFSILTAGVDGYEMVPSSRGTMVLRLGEDGSWKYIQNHHEDLPTGYGTAAEQGVVSRDGLTYENAALGLTVRLPQESPAATFLATDFTQGEDPGVYLTISFEDSPALAWIRAMSLSDYETYRAQDPSLTGGREFPGENSRWGFAMGYARSDSYAEPEETPGYEEFMAWLEETLPGCVTISEPTV